MQTWSFCVCSHLNPLLGPVSWINGRRRQGVKMSQTFCLEGLGTRLTQPSISDLSDATRSSLSPFNSSPHSTQHNASIPIFSLHLHILHNHSYIPLLRLVKSCRPRSELQTNSRHQQMQCFCRRSSVLSAWRHHGREIHTGSLSLMEHK